MSDPILADEELKYRRVREEDPRYGFGGRQVEWLRAQGNPFTREFMRTIASPEVDSALDIGCGGGTVMDLVKDHVRVEGIDIFPDAPAQRTDLRIQHMNAARLDFPDRAFDVVYHLDGMEHIPAEVEGEVLSEEFRVARRAVFHEIALVPSARDAGYVARGLSPLHVNLKSGEEWTRRISASGAERGFRLVLQHYEDRSQRAAGWLGTLRNLVRAARRGRRSTLCLVYRRAEPEEKPL